MANQKISQLTEKTTLDWWEEIPFAENWENGKFTTENLKEQILDEVDALPSQEWNDWKFLKTDWENASREELDIPEWWIQTLPWSPIDLKYKWNWSKAQFEALETYRADTEYNVIG